MSCWLKIESVPEQPITERSQSHICMINTSNNINPPSSPACQWAHTRLYTPTFELRRASSRECKGRHTPSPNHTHTHGEAYCTQILPRLHMKHADTAPSIMVNTSNSISFLDSWSLDRYGSDSTWFLTSCLPSPRPLQLPYFLYSLWSLFGWLKNTLPK